VTPSFQQGRYLAQNVASVRDQTYPLVEHIVRDGGSTDETLDLLRSASGSLRYVSEPDRGQTDALNKGLADANGQILGWVNSDDFLYPEAVSRAVAALETSGVDAVYGRCMLVDDTGGLIGFYRTEPFRYQRLVERNIIAQPALFFRRSLFDRFGPFDESLNLAMDYEYWLRCSRDSNFVYVPELFAAYRIHRAAKTASRAAEHAAEANRLRVRYGRGLLPAWRLRLAVVRTYLGGIAKSSRIGFLMVSLLKWQRIRN